MTDLLSVVTDPRSPIRIGLNLVGIVSASVAAARYKGHFRGILNKYVGMNIGKEGYKELHGGMLDVLSNAALRRFVVASISDVKGIDIALEVGATVLNDSLSDAFSKKEFDFKSIHNTAYQAIVGIDRDFVMNHVYYAVLLMGLSTNNSIGILTVLGSNFMLDNAKLSEKDSYSVKFCSRTALSSLGHIAFIYTGFNQHKIVCDIAVKGVNYLIDFYKADEKIASWIEAAGEKVGLISKE